MKNLLRSFWFLYITFVMEIERNLMIPTEFKRFLSFVEMTENCWLWTGGKTSSGYGGFSVFGRSEMVHRASYRHFKGAIPMNFEIDHLCNNKLCVNPDHLDAVDREENMKRSRERRTHCKRGHAFGTSKKGRRCPVCFAPAVPRTHCKRGHLLSGNNVYWVRQGKYISRQCKACHAIHMKRWYLTRKAKVDR